MSDFEAIDALLNSVTEEAELPAPADRVRLRETARLSKAQVARALGVSPSTIGGWEAGREPTGEIRTKYAYLLDGLRAKTSPAVEEPPAPEVPAPASGPAPATASASASGFLSVSADEELAAPQPCVLCGQPARDQVEGFPQHLTPEECAEAATPDLLSADNTSPSSATAPGAAKVLSADNTSPGPGAAPGVANLLSADNTSPEPPASPADPNLLSADNTSAAPPVPAADPDLLSADNRSPRPSSTPAGPKVLSADNKSRPHATRTGRTNRAFQEPSDEVALVAAAVRDALTTHDGDVEAATARLVRRAIPDAMALLDSCRKGARYEIIGHPPLPDILRKKTSKGADEIWEARPKWTRDELPPGRHEITALDINGAYLSALKTHLPIGTLEHSTGNHHDRRRAGVHLITPPAWEHEAVLPNPIGSRDEPGPLWVTEPTLRLLLRLSTGKYGLCDPPEIHESYTSGATENLLEKFRTTLVEARQEAIAAGDDVTLEYVKAMYSKFVATMGESNFNRELYRPDWMHLIRSQAFANLWMKAYRCYDEGLAVVRAMGTDELHVIGDWRGVFTEGRGVTEVKVKDVYTAGAETD
ncbi:helix-turn-helix domain-containing protein [Streptomyces sp. NPDC050504]|uniref:helix-turn-helix domain-containing protein n=1 Tax=Streptomyces sp. NPDC050504 TaxID=3365618 RepID=UPI0037B3573B